MRRKWNKGLVTLAMVSMMFCVSACGNKPSAETSAETESTTETAESEEETVEPKETAPLQTASGHQHNVDLEEKMKETDAEEEVQEEEREEEVQTESTTAEKEETEVPTTAPEATTAESTTAPTPSTPDMSQLEEWMPPVNMLVVCDANVVDENGNVLGPIEKGSDIGVTGQCPGFYQVNYGAKRSFLPKDCLSSR